MPDSTTLEVDLRTLISKILEIEEDQIGYEAKFVEDLGMDSVMALEILAAIEKAYRIHIPEEELVKMTCLRDVVKVTQRFLKE